MHSIENNLLKVDISPLGAELKSVVHKQHHLEYIWQADPAFWAKSSPVLFPIVGELKDKTYRYNGQAYSLPRHGFAREKRFEVTDQQANEVTFTLQDSEETMTVYPFRFRFSLIYTLTNDVLCVTYRVENRGEEAMFFSVGGHPAFRVPLAENTTYDDYALVFEKPETAGRWPISSEGLIETTPQPLLDKNAVLHLAKQLFAKDAVVLKDLQSENVTLQSDKTPHGLTFTYSGFTYLGLWAAPGADFVCIEPWCGIADSVDANGELENKEGIISLPGGETFNVSWMVKFF